MQFYIAGLQLAYVDSQTIAIGPGHRPDSTFTEALTLTTGLKKKIQSSGVWQSGTNGNGLDTGSRQANKTYHVFLLANATTGQDVVISQAASNPIMPSGWTKKALVGSVVTDGSGNIVPFRQNGRWFQFRQPDYSFAGANNQSVPPVIFRSLKVPRGRKVLASVTLWTTGTEVGWLQALDPDLTIPVISGGHYGVAYRATGSDVGTSQSEFWTDTSGRIYTGDLTVAGNVYGFTRGWFDPLDEAGLNTFEVVTVGDSLTHLYGWVPRAEEALLPGSKRSVRFHNLAVGGQDTYEAEQNGKSAEIVSLRPDAVIIAYGMAEAYKTGSNFTSALHKSRTLTMINAIKSGVPNAAIYLMTMNPILSPPAAAPNINPTNYYQNYRDLATSESVGLIDNYNNWISLSPTTTHIPDGVHPTLAAHELVTVPGVVNAILSLVD